MTLDELKPGPGEARTRKRQRLYVLYIVAGGLIGGLAGFFVGFFDQGDGNLFHGDWEALSLNPGVALAVAGALLVGFLALPMWGFRIVDDFAREHNYIGYTAGCLGVLSGFPVWAMLYAGGFAPAPHAFGVWLIGFVSMLIGYAYARWLR